MSKRTRADNPTIISNPAPIERGPSNAMYPLPPDYADLTEDGQRLARVNACCLRRDPEEYVTSWAFFRQAYLEVTPEGFFYKRRKASPPAHSQMVWDMAAYGRNVHVAPRGSAKSTVIGKEIPIKEALTRPFCAELLVLAIHPMVEQRFATFQKQFTDNEYIINDFGRMRPKHGQGKWSLTELSLANGATIRGVSVDGAKRGERPDMIILDDPEYDPDHPGQETSLRENLESLLFHQLLPMLDTDDQVFEWVGTLLNCRSALYAAAKGDDPRFKFFNRRIYSSSHVDDATGQTVYFWPQKWDAEALETKRQELGDLAFQAEYQNDPISDKDRAFHIHDDFDTYTLAEDKVYFKSAPDGALTTLNAREWLETMGRVFTVDLRHNIQSTSDFDGILSVGIDHRGTWWILDLFLGRVTGERIMSEAWRMGLIWHPQVVGIESVAGQTYFTQWFDSNVAKGTFGPSGSTWRPRCVWPIRYPHKLSKEQRINALVPRFANHRIRMPAHLKGHWPMSELWRQVCLYTPDGLSLDHDDAIDMLAMVPYCPRPTVTGELEPPETTDAYDQLMQGNATDPKTGLPYTSGLDISQIPWAVIQKFLASNSKAAYNKVDERRQSSLVLPPADRSGFGFGQGRDRQIRRVASALRGIGRVR
jgi:hypothetical protein